MIYKKGDIILRPFTELEVWDDVVSTNYREWFERPEIVELTSHGILPKTMESFVKYIQRNDGSSYIVYSICIEEERNDGNGLKFGKKHIGNIALQQINWINRSAELAIIIGEKDYHGKGIATFAVNCMLYHAFVKMGLHRVWSGTSEENKGMQRVFEKCGFDDEATFREAKWSNGKFVHIRGFGILGDEWEPPEEFLPYGNK